MPGTPTDRLAVVDTLRAVALFGIIVTHADMEYLAGLPPDPGFRTFGALDATVTEAVRLLASGKFFSIFSFLFGLSFAIQLDRATRKRAAFAGRFGWRLVILFAIGMAHSAFFSGDILTIYALLGFLLLPLNRFDSKVLLPLAVALALNVPGIANGIAQHVRTAPPTASAPAPALLQAAARQFDIKQNGTAGDVVRMNLRESLVSKLRYQIVSGRLWMTLGFFLLGVCAGRANLFQDTPSNRRFFRRLLLWSAPCAAITTAIAVAYPVGLAPRNAAQLLPYAAWYVQLVSLAAAYVALTALLYWRRSAATFLPAMGKMGLTSYLLQSVFGLFVFYGFGLGLLGRIGSALSVALACGFFVLQLLLARWWIERFAFGPVEWLWRYLTYFKMPQARPRAGAI